MSDELVTKLETAVSKLFDKVSDVAIEVSAIKSTLESDDKLCHENRIRALENTVSQWTGNKILIGFIITTAIAIYAAVKH